MDNHTAASSLRELGDLLDLAGESAFKVRAYRIAADRIAALKEPLDRLADAGRLREIPGVGAAIAAKIESLLASGHIPQLDRLRERFPAAGEERRARAARKPLAEALPLGEELLSHVEEDPGVHRATLAGAIRRWEPQVPAIELVASTTDPARTIDWFERFPAVVEKLEKGSATSGVLLLDGTTARLATTPEDGWATTLLLRTGPAAHVEALRRLAEERGFELAETGLYRGDGARLDPPDEAAIYADLGLQAVPPELRHEEAALDAAERHAIPRLLEEADVRGMTHCHTVASDGMQTVLEMAHAARLLGFEYLTITDHSQSSHKARGLSPDRLIAQWDEIARAQEEVPEVRILRGSEVDILADGTLDYPDALLEQLDVVIGSIHQRHSLDERGQTRRLVRALQHPMLSWIGHPTGRLVGSRAPYPLRMEEVMEAAVENGKALEVNGSPHRLDLAGEQIHLALRLGVKLVVSTDAHSALGMRSLRYGVGTARRGGATSADVLNTLPADAFLAALRGGGRLALHAAEAPAVD